jgi:hypothetical protein
MPTYTATITLNVKPDGVYVVSAPVTVDVYYSDTKVWGGGANNTFVANDSNTFVIESSSPITDSLSLTELMPNYYDAYDGVGGTWCYQPGIDRFTSKYSFRPEWMSLIGNRLSSFKDGKLFIHSGTYNSFYGKTFDTALAAVHNADGNTIKVYNGVAVEGDTPSRMHFRTEVPYVQSSDLVSSEFSVREGVSYSDILMDRLSPNTTGSYEEKLFKGDRVRGEVCKFIYFLSQPTTRKSFKFINIGFNPARGQSV